MNSSFGVDPGGRVDLLHETESFRFTKLVSKEVLELSKHFEIPETLFTIVREVEAEEAFESLSPNNVLNVPEELESLLIRNLSLSIVWVGAFERTRVELSVRAVGSVVLDIISDALISDQSFS